MRSIKKMRVKRSGCSKKNRHTKRGKHSKRGTHSKRETHSKRGTHYNGSKKYKLRGGGLLDFLKGLFGGGVTPPQDKKSKGTGKLRRSYTVEQMGAFKEIYADALAELKGPAKVALLDRLFKEAKESAQRQRQDELMRMGAAERQAYMEAELKEHEAHIDGWANYYEMYYKKGSLFGTTPGALALEQRMIEYYDKQKRELEHERMMKGLDVGEKIAGKIVDKGDLIGAFERVVMGKKGTNISSSGVKK